ncbi:MAG: HAD hydrolase family protein [Chitinophagales bacterium]|nr:HAD hydrolase family protein [Chitinophagales bacterium]MDW8394506.1 HAD hydrolase family protein [Chitinophagales bacterium]
MTVAEPASNVLELLRQTTAAVFDMDGVLTDGTVLVTESGEEWRRMHVHDGYALQAALQGGMPVFVVSGGHSVGAELRLQRLGITACRMGVADKGQALRELAQAYNLNLSTTLYMGDDLPDAAALRLCGIPCCPADAAPQIQRLCIYVSRFKGGQGCVRDVLEKVLTLQHRWAEL